MAMHTRRTFERKMTRPPTQDVGDARAPARHPIAIVIVIHATAPAA